MKTQRIEHNGTLLAIITKSADWQEGLNFISAESDFEQVGFWHYPKGQKLKAHIHLTAPREILKTQEVIFVKQGLLRLDIFSEQEEKIDSLELSTGDTAVLLNGGHGYEILEDNTQVLEVKNGPYVGVEKDKKLIIE
jgi:hypothetical protein